MAAFSLGSVQCGPPICVRFLTHVHQPVKKETLFTGALMKRPFPKHPCFSSSWVTSHDMIFNREWMDDDG